MSTLRPVFHPTHPHVAALERLGDEIAELSARLDAATAHLLTLIREFDERRGWNTGFRSCAEWLSWRIGLESGAARERVRVAHALGKLPLLSGALTRGELSYSKVRALTRIATPETESRLLTVGRAGTVAHVERIVRGWRRVDRLAEAREAGMQHRNRAFHTHYDDDGMLVIHGRLAPEVGALLRQALHAAWDTLFREKAGNTFESDAQHRADALALMVETALHHGMEARSSGEGYQVVIHVDGGQTVLDDGPRVSAETSERLTCDATRTWMRHDKAGTPVEVGRRTRVIPSSLRRALEHRDHGCRFPGCGVRHGQSHHIRHWARGGPTTLPNLVTLCRRHHRAVHEEGYQVTREADETLRFYEPDGTPLLEVPPLALLDSNPVDAIRIVNDQEGVRIGPKTGLSEWRGERFDTGWAIDVLHPRANPAC
jgi:5-methylcytosine-specific restriction endonuclease McrA